MGNKSWTKEEIETKVNEIITEQACMNALTCIDLTKDLEKDYGLDSLDAIEINMTVEEEFLILVSDDEIEKATTGNLIVETVCKKLKRKGLLND